MKVHVATTKGDATVYIRGRVLVVDVDGARIFDRTDPMRPLTEEERSELLLAPVSVLGIPNRALSRFKGDIETVADLASKTEEDILKLPSLGRGTLDAILRALEARGLSLRRA